VKENLGLSDCRAEVLAYAIEVERVLRANDHKPGWKDDTARDLAQRVTEEAGELLQAVGRCTMPTRIRYVVREAADVGAMAMMVSDVLGGLNMAAVARFVSRPPDKEVFAVQRKVSAQLDELRRHHPHDVASDLTAAQRVEEHLAAWVSGYRGDVTHALAPLFEQVRREADPEWPEYQRLRAKFEGGES